MDGDTETQVPVSSQNQSTDQEDCMKKKRSKAKKRSSRSASEKELSAFESLKKGIKANQIDFRDHFEELGKEIGVHDYKVIALLGVGSQGRVYLVQLMHTKELFAMKVFLKEQIIDHAKTTRSVLTEQRFLSSTDHPFITKLFHSFQSVERLFMVMEYCPGGELWTVIKRQPSSRLSEAQVRFYASEVLLVLEYTHSRGYIYRDLKPENILLHLDGHIRMADFGLSKQSDKPPEMKILKKDRNLPFFHSSRKKMDLAQGMVIKTDSLVGSVHYLAPEVLAVHGSYDVMADWWSFGVLLYDMLYGVPPFQGRCNEEIIMKILQADFVFHDTIPISSELKSLIKGLLKVEPTKRMCAKRGANDIKKHAFFEGLQWPLLRNIKPPIIPSVIHPEDTSNFELYEEDDCDLLFDFFSELSENEEALTKEEQKNFDEFQFARESFVRDIVGDIQMVEKSKKHKTKKRSGPARSRSELPKKRKKRTSRKVAGTMTKAQARNMSEAKTGPRRASMSEIHCLEYENFVGQNEEYYSNSFGIDMDNIGEQDKSSWPGIGNISPHLDGVVDPPRERPISQSLPVSNDYDQMNNIPDITKLSPAGDTKQENFVPDADPVDRAAPDAVPVDRAAPDADAVPVATPIDISDERKKDSPISDGNTPAPLLQENDAASNSQVDEDVDPLDNAEKNELNDAKSKGEPKGEEMKDKYAPKDETEDEESIQKEEEKKNEEIKEESAEKEETKEDTCVPKEESKEEEEIKEESAQKEETKEDTCVPKEESKEEEEIKEESTQKEESKEGEEECTQKKEEKRKVKEEGEEGENRKSEEKKKKKKKRSLAKKKSSSSIDSPKKESSKHKSKKSEEKQAAKEKEKNAATQHMGDTKANSFSTRKFLNKSAKRKPQRKE